MTLGKKLYTGCGAALLITIVMGCVSMYDLGAMGDRVINLGQVKARNLYLAGDVDNLTTDILGSARGMNLRAHMNEPAEAEKRYETVKTEVARVRKEGDEFVAKSTSADLRTRMQTEVLDKMPALMESIDEDMSLIQKGNLQAADQYFQAKTFGLANDISNAGDEITQAEEKYIATYADEAAATVAPARYLMIVMILIAIGVGAVLIWVVRGVNTLLQNSILELSDGADQVATAAGQVSSSSQSLAQGASEQAASLEETSASSEEINSMARKNTDNSRETAQLLTRSHEKVIQANSYLEEMVVSMEQINESSDKISKIIKVIDEIAFQTNILALNAAVEAARAGEAGMGFAVVADEVRSLAQRSAQAAKDTAILIEDSIAKSSEGKTKVDQVALAIHAVTEDSARVKVMVDEVSLGSEEQSRGIDQIGRAISQMEQVTQTNAASAEESAAAAEELSAQSETLKEILSRLQAMVGGQGASPSYARRPVRPAPAASPGTFRPSTKPASKLQFSASYRSTASPSGNSLKKTSEDFPMEESFQSF